MWRDAPGFSQRSQVDVGGRFHRLRLGDIFGEMAVLAPDRRLAAVRSDGARASVGPMQMIPVGPERSRSRLSESEKALVAEPEGTCPAPQGRSSPQPESATAGGPSLAVL